MPREYAREAKTKSRYFASKDQDNIPSPTELLENPKPHVFLAFRDMRIALDRYRAIVVEEAAREKGIEAANPTNYERA